MNDEAFQATQTSGKVTFFSRTKNRLWTKGEESGHFLNVVSMALDCDQDALLIQVNPIGPTCHTGTKTCWAASEGTDFGTLEKLENTIAQRITQPDEKSYVSSLMQKGIEKVAQKVGEEGVEVVIEALRDNRELFLNESADLLFHYLLLLQAKGEKLQNVLEVLREREKN